MNSKEMIQNIAEGWFLQEPAFYSLFCLQQIQENVRMDCEVRTGEGRIEYNPLMLSKKNLKEVELLLRIEMIRLFLKHPYERRPEGCSGEVISMGSDCTIADGYCLLKEAGALKGPGAYHLPMGQCYEWYCKALQNEKNENETSYENENDNDNEKNQNDNENEKQNEKNKRQKQSALWHDDALRQTQINELIERTTDWGSLSGDIVERIQASTQARLNCSMVFQGFKSNLLSSNRRLSRMRPNRRTGFLQMGSLRQIAARVLIAIDCSGSIDEEDLKRFFGIVNRLFLQGEISIDILQFDAEIQSIEPLQRALPQFVVHGRGGTNFQPVIDYYLNIKPPYDGLMILTDGEAPPPHFDVRPHALLWVCKDESAYQQHHAWMEKSGRCCWG